MNKDYFKEIKNETQAYLLGFIAADGCVYKVIREKRIYDILTILISETDKQICELVRDEIFPTKIIYNRQNTSGAINRKPQVQLSFSNILQMHEHLKAYGITYNKTYEELSFSSLREDLKIHFIRGYFDGDGSCYYAKWKGRNKVCVNFTNNTKNILIEIQEYFRKYDIHFKLEEKLSVKKNNYFVLAIYNIKSVLNFGNLIYDNANFFLRRKFDKFILVNTEVSEKFKIFRHRNA